MTITQSRYGGNAEVGRQYTDDHAAFRRRSSISDADGANSAMIVGGGAAIAGAGLSHHYSSQRSGQAKESTGWISGRRRAVKDQKAKESAARKKVKEAQRAYDAKAAQGATPRQLAGEKFRLTNAQNHHKGESDSLKALSSRLKQTQTRLKPEIKSFSSAAKHGRIASIALGAGGLASLATGIYRTESARPHGERRRVRRDDYERERRELMAQLRANRVSKADYYSGHLDKLKDFRTGLGLKPAFIPPPSPSPAIPPVVPVAPVPTAAMPAPAPAPSPKKKAKPKSKSKGKSGSSKPRAPRVPLKEVAASASSKGGSFKGAGLLLPVAAGIGGGGLLSAAT